jgi:hypothetical protein
MPDPGSCKRIILDPDPGSKNYRVRIVNNFFLVIEVCRLWAVGTQYRYFLVLHKYRHLLNSADAEAIPIFFHAIYTVPFPVRRQPTTAGRCEHAADQPARAAAAPGRATAGGQQLQWRGYQASHYAIHIRYLPFYCHCCQYCAASVPEFS